MGVVGYASLIEPGRVKTMPIKPTLTNPDNPKEFSRD